MSKSLAKLIQLKNSYNPCDIWRIRNLVTSTFTFKQKNCTGFFRRRLDIFFLSNSLQEFVNHTSILTYLSTDYSSLHLSLSKDSKPKRQ